MYRIGIIGHGPERFEDRDKAQRLVDRTIDLLGFQYGKDAVFNISGDIGVGLWAAQACSEQGHKYHLFLPLSVEQTSKYWFLDQQETLSNCYNGAYAITICDPSNSAKNTQEPGDLLIDQSSFVVFFWNGMKQGKVVKSIRHAFKENKLSLNAMEDMKLITAQDLRKRKHKIRG